jgi:hypothetical protein
MSEKFQNLLCIYYNIFMHLPKKKKKKTQTNKHISQSLLEKSFISMSENPYIDFHEVFQSTWFYILIIK